MCPGICVNDGEGGSPLHRVRERRIFSPIVYARRSTDHNAKLWTLVSEYFDIPALDRRDIVERASAGVNIASFVFYSFVNLRLFYCVTACQPSSPPRRSTDWFLWHQNCASRDVNFGESIETEGNVCWCVNNSVAKDQKGGTSCRQTTARQSSRSS